MLKKIGAVAVGVTAALVTAAPLASAAAPVPGAGSCEPASDSRGNTGQLNTCNIVGQGNGQGNTVNGTEIPAPPVMR